MGDEIGDADELWVENENNGADKLWVENEIGLGGSVLGGDNLDGGANAGVQSQWWCDLGGTISIVRTQGRDLVGVFGVGARSSSLSLSLSLSLSPHL